jgi:hypothetical protein
MGAGYAEITDPIYEKPGNEYSLEGKTGLVIGPSGASINFGDDPLDHQAVQFGVQLYNRYGHGLTYDQLRNELASALDSFAHHTPSSRPVPRETAIDWPYWVGYFEPSSQ